MSAARPEVVFTDSVRDEVDEGAAVEETAIAGQMPGRLRRGFVHLSVHTEFSLVDSTLRIKPLAKSAASSMPAIAVTDRSNLFALVKFYRAAMGAGVKPIAGVDVRLGGATSDGALARATLLVMNEQGYLNLTKLVSKAFQEGQSGGEPVIQTAWLEQAHDGLIMLSGGVDGDVGLALRRNKLEEADAAVQRWKNVFGDRYYLELVRTQREFEAEYIAAACQFAATHKVPVVATNDVRFLVRDDYRSHEARVCIAAGYVLADPKRPQHISEEQYLKSPEEMEALFADIPVALDNTIEIARRCNLELALGTPVLPDFPIPEGMTETDYFYATAREGLEKRLDQLFDRQAADFDGIRKPYDERLQIELDVIAGMGFPGYFLIVADFIRWARENGVPVGPGRGSGAGSLVAYALMITDLDPLEYDLLFERFLNPERVSMPDFDIDFCMDGRDRVIAYVAEKYGHHRVSQIITYGTMAAKAVVRDVGRIMSHPYGFVDRLAKMVPFEVGMTLDKAMAESEDLQSAYRDDEEVTAVIDMALSLEGLSRNCGKHAGGVVIAPTALTDFAPLYCEPDGSSLVTQFDKDDAEAVGLVKFDFLGLRTLTIIDNAVKVIDVERAAAGEPPLDLLGLPLDDRPTYTLLQKARTTAVFQLESAGMKRLIDRLRPDSFEDIIALVALYRPGPLQSGMVDDFIDRKHGRKKMAWPHEDYQLESLRPILEPTYGVILYQEQVMGIAQTMAGFSLGTADILRRAMGKKKAEEMAKQRQVFLDGCTSQGIDASLAGNIFDLVEKFAGYGFNKSHSAAYALLSYQTAWLKCHHPAAFMSAVLSADMDNTDKVVVLIEECREMGLTVESPDVNRSEVRFSVSDDHSVLYGLAAIKGVGEGALGEVLHERSERGPFASLDDLCRRIPAGTLNRRILEAMVRAGACDSLWPLASDDPEREAYDERASLFAAIGPALAGADQFHKNKDAGQVDLFGLDESPPEPEAVASRGRVLDWTDRERLSAEKNTLGLYLSGHPIEAFAEELRHFTHGTLKDVCAKAGDGGAGGGAGGGGGQWRRAGPSVVAAGLVLGIRQRDGQGGRMLIVTLDDGTGRVEAVLRGELIDRAAESVQRDEVLVVEGEVSFDDFSGGYRVRAREVMDLAAARDRFARRLVLKLESAAMDEQRHHALLELLGQYKGGTTPLGIVWRNGEAEARFPAGPRYAVRPAAALIASLEELLGQGQVKLLYRG
jgi:DNA polymerase-3 subunit alpha